MLPVLEDCFQSVLLFSHSNTRNDGSMQSRQHIPCSFKFLPRLLNEIFLELNFLYKLPISGVIAKLEVV